MECNTHSHCRSSCAAVKVLTPAVTAHLSIGDIPQRLVSRSQTATFLCVGAGKVESGTIEGTMTIEILFRLSPVSIER